MSSTVGSSSTTRDDAQHQAPGHLHQSAGDATIPGVIQRFTAAQFDQMNEHRRTANRQAMLVNLLPPQSESEVIEKRNPPPFPAERSGQKLLLRVLQLNLEPVFEPIFGTIALYDIKERRKISENFYFDVNSETMKELIAKHVSHEDEASHCRQASFAISSSTADVFIVIKLEKVLQACDVNEAVEPYVKEERNREKLLCQSRDNCERLGAYRMPLAWMAIDMHRVLTGATSIERTEQLMSTSTTSATSQHGEFYTSTAPQAQFDDTDSIISADRSSTSTASTFRRVGSASSAITVARATPTGGRTTPLHKKRFFPLVSQTAESESAISQPPPPTTPVNLANLQPLTLNLNSFFRQDSDRLTDEDIYKILAETRKKDPSKLARLKAFPAQFKLELSGVGVDELPMRLTPELLRIHPFVPAMNADLTKEMVEFSQPGQYAVNSCYRNLLYVYPKSVNLSARSGTARNITVCVQLMNSCEVPLYAIFGRSSCPNLAPYANTTVIYHNKCPQFNDEIKLQLPVDLNDGHHLLFTFYHIACKANKSIDEIEYPIGYAWIPLYKDGRLQTGEFSLPIALERLPPSYGYLSPDVMLPNIKWLEGHKPLFNVTLHAVTTDPHLDAFFRAYHSLTSSSQTKSRSIPESDLKLTIQNILKARPEPLVAFLYVILDKLLALLANPPFGETNTGGIALTCFEMLGQIVKVCTMLLDGFCDAHGRSTLLTTYIHYHKIAMKACGVHLCSPSGADQSNSAVLSYGQRLLSATDGQDLVDIINLKSQSAYGDDNSSGSSSSPPGLKKAMHEELITQWLQSTGAAREMAFVNAWFFLELTMKSMAEYLTLSNRLYLPRRLRFSEHFIVDLSSLIQAVTIECINRSNKDTRQAQAINAALAFFLRDAFSVMDRGYVMTMIKHYNRELAMKIGMSPDATAAKLMHLKLDFIRIVSSYEHFVILNLPFASSTQTTNASIGSGHSTAASFANSMSGMSTSASTPQLQPPSPSNSNSSRSSQAAESHGSVGSAELTADFRSRHFLVGLALSDLAAVLDCNNTALHARAIGVIRSQLATHEADSRLTDAAMKSRVAALYLPLVGIVLDAIGQLHDPFVSTRNATTVVSSKSFSGASELVFGGINSSSEFAAGRGNPLVNSKLAAAIAGMAAGGTTVAETVDAPSGCVKPTLTLEFTMQLLACFAWTLKHVDRSALRQWLREISPNRMTQFLDVLQLCVSCFEYRISSLNSSDSLVLLVASRRLQGPPESTSNSEASNTRIEDAFLGPSRKKSAPAGEVRWRKESTNRLITATGLKSVAYSSGGASSEDQQVTEAEAALEASLSTEIALTVLDALELLMRVLTMPASDHLHFVLPHVLRVQMHMLACNQSVQTLDHVFASQRSFVFKYPELVFEQETEQCGELCLQLLRHCSSRLPAIRSQAAASLYLLMRQSFECAASLPKVKMQITMSLSTLVSSGTRFGFWLNEDCLRRSLKTVLTYAESDSAGDQHLSISTFSEQVKDLVFNLHMILSDTVKMKEFANDFEMLIDLMYRVAKGYQNNPDLRLTWLLNMASKQAERENYTEAAHCMLHAAALAAEYVAMRGYHVYMPRGAVAFLSVSDNVLEESAVSDDVISPDEEGICESRHFTEAGLVHLVEKTAQFFEKAQMYESMVDVYKVIEPILEHWRDYRRLALMHNRLSEAIARIEPTVPFREDIADLWDSPLPNADKRSFGTYFRIGFYGTRFGDLDGEEFVYKEPAFTKLSEISHRLETFYCDRFGKDTVQLIKDSNTVDCNRLDSSRCFVQITYVEPYLEKWERRRRPTHFERNTKLTRFVYATPFTKDGKAHGALNEQYKRRTVLTTQYSFPYVKTRVRVIAREVEVRTPIEVAIEDVQKKTRELAAATALCPADAKMLQMVLQGCIGTTVNQGPLQMATVFLSSVELDEHGKPRDRLQNKLRLCFKDFSKKCADALQMNRQLIQPDQQAYQNELQKNYLDFTKRMAPIVGCSAALRREQQQNNADNNRVPPAITAHALALAVEMGPVTEV